jgi:hypothetical protein
VHLGNAFGIFTFAFKSTLAKCSKWSALLAIVLQEIALQGKYMDVISLLYGQLVNFARLDAVDRQLLCSHTPCILAMLEIARCLELSPDSSDSDSYEQQMVRLSPPKSLCINIRMEVSDGLWIFSVVCLVICLDLLRRIAWRNVLIRAVFAKNPAPLPSLKQCGLCEISATASCARCKTVYYCCVAHQCMDWSVHKQTCMK